VAPGRIVAVNPDPLRFDGLLCPSSHPNCIEGVERVVSVMAAIRSVTMAKATLHDGQRLLAFNDFFIEPIATSQRGTASATARNRGTLVERRPRLDGCRVDRGG